MSRLYFLLIGLLLLANVTIGQTTYTWVGSTIGDYQVAGNWSPARSTAAANDILAFNATTPLTIANVPNQTIGALHILSGTSTVTLSTNVVTNILSLSAATPLIYSTAGSILAGDLLTISLSNSLPFSISSGTFGIAPSTGGKISISSLLTLSGGTLDFDVAGTGGTTINSGASITYASGTFNSSNAAAITWANGSNYYHAVSGVSASSIPVSTWLTGSACNITGFSGGTVAPTGFTGVSFANMVWNCTGQAGNIDLDFLGQPVNIMGTLTVTNTSTYALRFSNSSSVIVNAASYNQTGGTLVLQSSSGNTTLSITNNFSHSGGTIDFAGSGGTASSATLAVKGNLAKGVTSTWSSSSNNTASQMNIQFTGTSSQVVTIAGFWNAPAAGRCNIINTNTDAVGVSLNSTGVAGSLKVTNINSSTAATCTNSGNFTGAGIIVYSGSGAGANNFSLVYNGSFSQTASSVEFPATNGPYNLTIAANASVGFPVSFNRTVPGRLTMTSGGLNIGGGNTLSLTNTSLATQLAYTGGFVTSGTLSRHFPVSGLPTSAGVNSLYPFGTGTNDRSVNVFFSTANLTGGISGDIAISHTALVNATAITSFTDNGSVLDKRTNTNWVVNTGTFALGSGGTTLSITALGTNIGSVDDISTLRLTDAIAGFGTLIATTGTTDAPLVGKSGLVIADINAKTFYIGSDNTNALQIVTFTWTGASNTLWTNPANWTGGVGYPAAPTEIAIVNTVGGNMPVIPTGTLVSVYQLTVGASASLTMLGTAGIAVYDLVTIDGTVSFSSTSTFTYASSVSSQNILDLAYGNLAVTGTASKILPAVTTVTGDFSVSGVTPTFGTGTFVYAAGTASLQRVAATTYYNLTITGNRSGNTIRLGNGVSNNTLDVANVFTMTATNYVANDGGYNTFNFSSASTITIPGFTYGNITNVAPAGTKRIYDPLGSADNTHMIVCRSMAPVSPYVTADNTVTGSKIKFIRSGSTTLSGFNYNDFELAGDFGGANLVIGGQIGIAGTFTLSAINYNLNTTTGRFFYNGTASQTITPFNYNDLWIAGTGGAAGTRIITLPNYGTVGVRNQLAVTSPTTFSAGNGFTVTNSTVNFFTGSNNIPVLAPLTAGGNNYHNLSVTGGTRILAGDLKLGGDLTVTGTDANLATLNIGNATANRNLTVAGNVVVNGTSSSAALTSTIDFNAGARNVVLSVAGNVSIAGTSQVTTTNGSTVSGTILFNGTSQQYNNTAIFKNGFVNFTIGNGTAATTLTLNNSVELIRSGTAPFSAAFTVAANSILNAGNKNITVGIDDNNVGNNAVFNLNANATFITANTGVAPNTAIEGTAVDGTTGTILEGSKIVKTYNTAANYVLNGATVNPFPASIGTMANLTIGAPVSLNKAIVATATLDLASYTLTQASNNLQFSGLTSTTGNIYADKNSALSISGTVGTVGTLRFATGGNITGQFTINRPVTIPLNSDLTIDKTPLTGDFITGAATSILDINGNTLIINGAVSGPGFISGSNTSNLTLGGTAGTVSFTAGKRLLKNLSLVNNATATLGTVLDITEGVSAGNEGTVSVTGTAVLTTGGNLTLKSGATGTARVAQGATGGGYISGDVTVERYLPAVRAWRFLAAPTVGQTIKQSWQENQAAGVDPGTGYGTIISSNSGSWSANGFDFNTPGNSLLFFNGSAWQGVANTNSQIALGGNNKSYMLFSRGNRSITPAMGTGAAPTPILLRTKGALFQGNLPPVTLAAPGAFASIGNNYACAIDFTLLTKTNIDNSFSVWDPKIPGAQGLGGWVTFSASTTTPWVPVPGGGSYPAGVPNRRIESGQAFMIHTTAGSANITLNESSKLSGSSLVSRPMGGLSLKSGITTNLYNMNTGEANIADGNAVVFSSDYSNAIDENDAIKATNFGDNFGLLRNGLPYVVEAREPVTESDTIFFNMRKIKLQPYRLEFIVENFDNSMAAFLEDKFLTTSTPISMNGTSTVDFSVTSNVASAAVDRFRIVFKNLRPLPVTFTSITAVKNNNGNEVEWKVENEINIDRYEIERSTDGVNFTKVGSVAAGNNRAYNWFDAYPVNGDNFYRIKSVSNRGSVEYSRIVKVSAVKGRTGYTVYPNPSTDGSFGLQMSNLSAGLYTVKITNGNGQLIWKQSVNHPGGTSTNAINPTSQLGSGNYQVEVIDITGKSTIIKVMVL
jgi:hypothetical protein